MRLYTAWSLPATADLLLLKEMLLFPQARGQTVPAVTSLPLLPQLSPPPASALHAKHRVPGRPAIARLSARVFSGPCKAWRTGKNKGALWHSPLSEHPTPLPAPVPP